MTASASISRTAGRWRECRDRDSAWPAASHRMKLLSDRTLRLPVATASWVFRLLSFQRRVSKQPTPPARCAVVRCSRQALPCRDEAAAPYSVQRNHEGYDATHSFNGRLGRDRHAAAAIVANDLPAPAAQRPHGSG